MMTSGNGIALKSAGQDSSKPQNGQADPEKKLVLQSVRMGKDLHAEIRRIAYERDVSIHSLIIEGLHYIKELYPKK